MWTLSVAGEIDLATADELAAAGAGVLDVPGITGLTVDLAGVMFIDSTGLGALLRIRQGCADRGVELALQNVPRIAARLLEITGLSEVLGAPLPAESE